MRKATENQTVKEWIEWLEFFRKHNYNLSKDERLALRDAITTYSSVAENSFSRLSSRCARDWHIRFMRPTRL